MLEKTSNYRSVMLNKTNSNRSVITYIREEKSVLIEKTSIHGSVIRMVTSNHRLLKTWIQVTTDKLNTEDK